jgi:hypothetical protein
MVSGEKKGTVRGKMGDRRKEGDGYRKIKKRRKNKSNKRGLSQLKFQPNG